MERIDLPNWETLMGAINRIQEYENLTDFIEDLMEEMKEQEEGSEKGKFTMASSPYAINMYPGVPGGCTPIFLVLIPKPTKPKRKGMLWRTDPEFYARVLWEFGGWIDNCDKFPERFVMVISERKPYPTPKSFRYVDFDIDIFHDPREMINFSEFLREFSTNLDLIVSSGIYHFLKNHWPHPFSWHIERRKQGHYFSWYIKKGYKLVHFDGKKVW